MTRREPGPDFATDYLALRREAGVVDLPRDVVRARGPDAEAFLQGQLSQDVAALTAGASAWTFVLAPHGKVDGFARVTRTADDTFVLDTDAGAGEALIARLERFKLRTRCDLEPLDWRCLAVRGPAAAAVRARLTPPPPDQGFDAPADWPGLPGFDRLGADPAAPEGLRRCGLDAYEAVRIEAGVPLVGAELTEDTIPAEAGIVERAVSFTKGCFTGQELVARIDARGGNVPRHLRGVLVARNVRPPVGATLVVDGKDVGALTSVAESLDRRAPVALAYVRRAVEPPAEATVVWDGGEAPARIEALPLVT